MVQLRTVATEDYCTHRELGRLLGSKTLPMYGMYRNTPGTMSVKPEDTSTVSSDRQWHR